MPIDYAIAATMLTYETLPDDLPSLSEQATRNQYQSPAPKDFAAYLNTTSTNPLQAALLEPRSHFKVMKRPVSLSVNRGANKLDSAQMKAYRKECKNLRKAFPGYPQPAHVTVQFNVPF